MKKNFTLPTLLILLFAFQHSCFSQTMCGANAKLFNSYKNYTGRYYLQVSEKSNPEIKFDYITLYIENGVLKCRRDFLYSFKKDDEALKDKLPTEYYDILDFDTKNNKMVIQYKNNVKELKLKRDTECCFEIVFFENALIYEKR